MIKLAYLNVENLDLEKSYNLLPKERKDKVDFYRFDKDKKLSAGAYLLLKKLLKEIGIDDFEIKIGKYGKAYISDQENIYFNMSHSSKFVACAISDKEVGVDIEYNDPTIDLNIAKNYFYNQEYESIMKSQNPSDEFFNYWVLKESYMKYTGLGFNLDLDSFEIILEDEITLKNDKNNIKFNLFDLKEYKLAIASSYNVDECFEYEISEIY
ncbi:MAG: 4'-phosphopantetheinyl transferase superfamily protein [Methanobrevibacter sp.]|uniref:4'-phosphopantetheinyl transferase family protein n=1 Tax=Methanobrevibacter sp. TaxID=66852 RepID=UPI001B2F4823|nr:4'-phosphopantetheinyl transferase superfamily protein [Methanobrevibacter sp.]MBO5151428.1 4'-phosphopantetheinyl transferase superfamily protein [Methanobrevibacter sp.]MBO6109411.1 4'-phosphopantetheinyl transferase superfamily protein [Methanobrevibacter sp.]